MSLALANLPDRVLENLEVIEVGQTPETDHETRVTNVYTEVYEALVDEGLIYWGVDDDIPDGRALSIIALVSARMPKTLIRPEMRTAIQAEADSALAFLRRKSTNKASYRTTIKIKDY